MCFQLKKKTHSPCFPLFPFKIKDKCSQPDNIEFKLTKQVQYRLDTSTVLNGVSKQVWHLRSKTISVITSLLVFSSN